METTLSLPVFIITNTQFVLLILFKTLADAVLFTFLFLIFTRSKFMGSRADRKILKSEAAAVEDGERDEEYKRAVALVQQNGKASTPFLQRRLRVGYNRAARMIEMMEQDGIVGHAKGASPRDVLLWRNNDRNIRSADDL